MFSKQILTRSLAWAGLAVAIAVACQPAAAQVGAKFGVFDAQRVSEETTEGRAVQDRLTTFRNVKQAELTALETVLSEQQNQLTSQALSLSSERRSSLEKEIQRGALELNQKRETAAREMQLEVNDAQSEFQDKLLAVINQFGEEEGFDMILEASLVAYTKPTHDVTTALIDRFNRAFPLAAAGAETPGN